ncbi:hypothetical protein EJ05DRAFT_436627 [Pseudovirgaria hyperparasitica]|uniref:Heme peroxidase n=1 Tax=Pseudovirgaria hyperparasitica TaxID=470096 RepID=A0A6A6WEN8_9PEZI|nr:uncharacterized protein EJ05DRAFT_436627 [Pseudovirgaria hyperparasitica]KAF2760619.1 hypothetical protein EJ05DRAFT_436627 [Pseudovirgaria hyperparasitica]
MGASAPEPPHVTQPSDFEKTRNSIGAGFRELGELISHVRKPIPRGTGNGTDLDEEEKWHFIKQVESGLQDLSHLGVSDISSLIAMQHKVATGQVIDDKQYLMEGLIKAAAGLPQGSANGKKITDSFVTQLWNDLQHPPQSYLGDQYAYRTADGSYNSLKFPGMGAANMPYARSVKPMTVQPGARPDPGLLFDALMARPEHYDYEANKHPNRISSVLFYVASIIVHDCFRTDHKDYSMSLTSSYLDLAPLYGSNQEEQDRIRTFKDGKLKPDTFSEKRLLSFPPGVSVLLVMFNRFHNYVVEQLAAIDEGKQFSKLKDPKDKVYKKFPEETQDWKDTIKDRKYEEALFQTGRLITCGLYINIILIDYVRTILNLNRTNSKWQLNPRAPIKDGPELGVGNQVSAEFNLVYRWHATVSKRDEEWTKQLWEQLFGDRDANTIGEYEFLAKLKEIDEKSPKDPAQRTFGGLKRDDKTGRFKDDDLVKIITESIEDCANSFGAQRVPAVMRAIEILGIKQSRAWNLATLNEFRKHFGLEPHRTFEDINPQVADELKNLYDHPDLVEIYPGIVAESAKQPMAPGSGLCPSYTVSRAVLSDAVALVRGDRFYTVDYHPRKLTNWGYKEVDFDLDVNNGCVFYKLFARAFPDHFEPNSVYAHFPMTTPDAMKVALKDLESDHLYTWEKPKFKGEHHMTFSYKAADQILGDQKLFNVTWGQAMELLMGKPAKNFMLAGDGYQNTESRKRMEKALYIDGWNQEVRKYYEHITQKLLHEKSYKLAGKKHVDIVRDVGNLAHVHFCAELFMLPLKTDNRPGVFTEHELYLIMTAVFAAIFFDLDPGSSFSLRQKAAKATQTLGKLVEANVQEIKAGGIISSAMQLIWPESSPLQDYGKKLIKRLLDTDTSVHDLVWGQILGTAGGMVSNQGQLFGQILDYFFTRGQEHLPEIHRLSKLDDDASFDKLMHYVLEASRLNGETAVIRQVTQDTSIQDGDKTMHVKKGERVFVNLRSASHDPAIFPDPDKVNLNRPVESYIHLGAGPHQCLGLKMTRISLTSMLKVVGRLENLAPVRGPQGEVKKTTKRFFEGDTLPESVHYHKYLTENWDSYFPVPCSLKVCWD